MTPAPRNRSLVRAIFDRAVELPPSERASLLARECGGDQALLLELSELLQLHGEAPEALSEPVPRAGERPGDRIGAYELVERIGEGGFGVVFRAEQHSPVRRSVALKVLKAGMDTAQVVGRFEAERQALAVMDHPDIARVFDGGVTPAGRPYFVMELVQGLPITRHCDQFELRLDQRLALFVPVCHAVQHAHQKGIVHRDLKPSNVLVVAGDRGASPKVIDFGIAKAIRQGSMGPTVTTGVQPLLGTPEYMAPEQADPAGRDIDTRADVYSLGVLLYELLTGARPFEWPSLAAVGYAEIIRTLKEVEPKPPSVRLAALGESAESVAARRRISPRALAAILKGDLDWIVMRALEKDRDRRYASAAALAEDVQRYLGHEPVLAGPPGRLYRLRKAMRRHRVAILAGVVVAAGLAGGGVAAALGYREARDQAEAARVAERQADRERTDAVAARAEEERQRRRAEERGAAAEREAAKNRRLFELLRQMLAGSDPDHASRPDYTLRELLDDFDRGLPGLAAHEPGVELGLRSAMAQSYLGLGLPDAAERHAVRARTLVEGASDLDPLDPVRVADLLALCAKASCRWKEAAEAFESLLALHADEVDFGSSHRWRCHRAQCLSRLGDHGAAIELLESAAELARREGEDLEVARAQQFLSGALYERNGPQDLLRAEALARDVLDVHRRLLPESAPEIAASLGNLATLLGAVGRSAEATGMLEEALQRDLKRYGEEHRTVALSRARLARGLIAVGEAERAESLLRDALTVLRRGPGRADELVFVLEILASLHTHQRRYREAATVLDEALTRCREEYGQHDLVARLMRGAADVRLRIDGVSSSEGLEMLQASLAMSRQLHGDDHLEVATSRALLGAVLLRRGEPAAAERELRAAASIERRDLPRTYSGRATTLCHLADSLFRQGQYEEAARWAEEALAIGRQNWAPGSPLLGGLLIILGCARWEIGELAAAEVALAEALRLVEASPGQDREDASRHRYLLARVLLDEGEARAEEAERVAGALLDSVEATRGQDDPGLCGLIVLRAEARRLGGRTRAAEEDLQRALRLCRAAPKRDAALARAQLPVARELLALGRHGEAEPLLRESLELLARLDADSTRRWTAASMLGEVLTCQGNFAEAEAQLLPAQKQLPAVMPEPHGRIKRETLVRLVALYERWGKPDLAAGWRSRLPRRTGPGGGDRAR